MTAPRVSVVIPCFNAAPWIAEAIESVYRQQRPEMEIIVVDDGSTDGSADGVRARFPAVHILSIPHAGASAARTAGTKIASGEFLQYLDADDRLADGKWQSQLQALESQGADIAYGDWRKCVETPGLLRETGSLMVQQLGPRPELDLLSQFWCPPAVYLFRRRIVEAVGGWNETLLLNEDVRFVLDGALRGARFVYVPGVAALYRVHAGLTQTRDQKTFLQCCLRNDLALENSCTERGALDAAARNVLLTNYLEIARNSCVRFPAVFEEAHAALERLAPGFIPARPRSLSWASRVLGYRRAEVLAYFCRRLKKFLLR